MDTEIVYTVMVGLYDKESHKQEIPTDTAKDILNKVLVSLFDGATMWEGVGIYKHNDGSIVTEPSLIITLFYTNDDKVKRLCNTLKQDFNQESISVIKKESQVGFW